MATARLGTVPQVRFPQMWKFNTNSTEEMREDMEKVDIEVVTDGDKGA